MQKLAASTCDRRGRRMTPDEASEWYEMVSLDFDGGFDSVFGHGAHVSLDLCQHCLRETLGAWLRASNHGLLGSEASHGAHAGVGQDGSRGARSRHRKAQSGARPQPCPSTR